MRVVLCQRKNGLPLSLAFFMKPIESLTSTSSNVVMSYLASAGLFCHLASVRRVRARRKRAFVDDLLLTDFAPARLLGGVVGVGRPAMHEITRSDAYGIRSVGYEYQYGSDMASRWYR